MSESVHLVCHYCHGINRIPGDRLVDGPKCGKCQRPLLNGAPALHDAQSFDRHLRRNDLPMLVDFWSPSCGPCMTMAPIFDKAAHKLEPAARLAKVNVEENQQVAMQFGIRSIPTLVLFKGGREIDRAVGAMDLDALVAWTRRHL